MPRAIPTPIQLVLSSPASTTCRLIRFSLRNGTVYGICSTNMDVTYDHGDGVGPILYSASNAFDPAEFASDSAFSVDNSQGNALIASDVPGITVEDVQAGVMDDAQWVCYLVDYTNPAAASAVILDAGDVGVVKVSTSTVYTPELLSYAIRLRQAIGDSTSKTCRAVFASPGGTPRGCGVDDTNMWANYTVTAVGGESQLSFNIALGTGDNYYPGRVQFLSGANIGAFIAVGSQIGNTITLTEETPYAIAIGDTLKIRQDCDKTTTMCTAYGNFLNMKAEPLIPDADSTVAVPGNDV